MVLIRLAVKNAKAILSNYLIIAFIILMPIMQLYMIKLITDNAAAAAAGMDAYQGFVDIVLTSKVNYGNLMEVYSSGILVQFILLTGMIAGSMMITEREQKTMLRLCSVPISKLKLLSGMLLGHSAVLFIITSVIILITRVAFDVSWGSSWINVLLVTVFAVFSAAAMAFLISGLFRSSKVAGGVMSMVVIGMTFMSGGIIQSDSLDVVSNFTINKWISEAYLSLMQGNGLESIAVNLLVLAAIGGTMMLIASMIYRRENLYE